MNYNSLNHKSGSLPILSLRAMSTERERERLDPQHTLNCDENNKSARYNNKRTTSFSSRRPSSRIASIANGDSLSKLYERVSESLLSRANKSAASMSEVKKSRVREIERPQRISSLLSLINADIYETFLEPYTQAFMGVVTQNAEDINFDVENPTEDNLNGFILQQSDTYTVLKKVIDECVVGKVFARNGLEQIGRVIASVIDSLMVKSTKVLQACRPQLQVKTLLNQQKEQQAMTVTRNERTLFEAVRLVNYVQNPIFTFDVETREKYIHSLLKCKQTLQESKTTFRIDTINNFEEDLKKLSKMFTEIKNQNAILVAENDKLKALFSEVNDRYYSDQRLLKLKNQLIMKGRDEEADKVTGFGYDLTPLPEDNLLITQQPEQADSQALMNSPPKSAHEQSKVDIQVSKAKKGAIKDESQTFVIEYLQKENKNLEGEILKLKQDIERWKGERSLLAKKNQELEEVLQVKTPNMQDAQVQCVFASEKPEVIINENTIEKMLEGKDPLKMTAVVHDIEWLETTVTMIYLEKFQADLQDDLDSRPRKNLRAFCKEWFINKFGFQQAAEVFLRDFLATLSSNVCVHPRYRTFGMLIGLDDAYDLKLPESISTSVKDDSKIVREYFKRQFIMSNYGISIFNKAVLLIKNSKLGSQFEGFLPGLDGNDDDTLEIKNLVGILRDLLIILSIPSEEAKQILGQFNQLVEGDKFFKLVERQLDKNKLKVHEEIEQGLAVRLDYYLQFVLENVALCFIKDLEKIYMHIRLTNDFINHSNVSVDLFRDTLTSLNIERPSRWYDLSYEAIMAKDVKISPPLFQTLGQLAPHMMNHASVQGKAKLPEDGYPVYQVNVAGVYNEKDVQARIKKIVDVEINLKLLKTTHQLVKGSLTKYQRRAGNVEYLHDLFEKDLNNIKTIVTNLKFTHRQSEKDKVKNSIDTNWKRLRTMIKVRHFIPKEQVLAA